MGSFDPERELEQAAYLLEMKAWQAASHLARAGSVGLLSSSPREAGARAGGGGGGGLLLTHLQPPALSAPAAGAAGGLGPCAAPAHRTAAGTRRPHSLHLLNLGSRQAPRAPGQPRRRAAGALAGGRTASGEPHGIYILTLEKSPLLSGTEIPPAHRLPLHGSGNSRNQCDVPAAA